MFNKMEGEIHTSQSKITISTYNNNNYYNNHIDGNDKMCKMNSYLQHNVRTSHCTAPGIPMPPSSRLASQCSSVASSDGFIPIGSQ